MNIGNIIKKMRKSREMTQEDLAAFLDISAQAVSRWETNLALPDITMLPGLANLFGITIDELLGMDEIRNQSYLNETFQLAHEYILTNKYAEAANILRKAIKTFPDNYGLMSDLAISLSLGDVSTEEGKKSAKEAIALCERVLANSTNDKLRSTTCTNLCFLYKITGAEQKAVELGRKLPHFWESREMILPELLNGQEAIDYLVNAINSVLAQLCGKISNAESGENSFKKILAIGPEVTQNTIETRAEMIGRISEFLDRESNI